MSILWNSTGLCRHLSRREETELCSRDPGLAVSAARAAGAHTRSVIIRENIQGLKCKINKQCSVHPTPRTWTSDVSLNYNTKPASLPMSNVISCVAEIFLTMAWLGDVFGYALAKENFICPVFACE